MTRDDGRGPDEMRPVSLELGCLKYAEGSCMAAAGNTRVLCAASVERRVPSFLVGSGQGWVTAEYGLLPRRHDNVLPAAYPAARQQAVSSQGNPFAVSIIC